MRQENAQEDVEEVSKVEEKDNEFAVPPFAAADNEFDSNDNNNTMQNNDAKVLAPKLGNSNNTILYVVVGIGLAIALAFYGPKIWNTLKKWKKRRTSTNEFEEDSPDVMFQTQYPY